MTENADILNNVVERRHDPLCGFYRESGEFDFVADACARCEFIAKVRADEREKAVQRVESCRNKFKARDFNDAVDACAAAVRGES